MARRARAAAAKRGEGTTLFDWIVEIIEAHGPGGPEAGDNVVLRLLDNAYRCRREPEEA